MNGKDIIITGLQNFEMGLGSNCRNIALEFAKDNRVLYVNPPIDRATQIKNIFDRYNDLQLNGSLKKINDNLFLLTPSVKLSSINWIKNPRLFDFFNKKNNRRFSKDIGKAARELGFRNYVLFTDGDMFRSFYMKDMLKPEISIYYLRDYFLSVPYWKTHGTRLEPELIKKSDIVFTNSEYLAEYSGKFNSRSLNTGQGCDFVPAGFRADIPEELKNIKKPLIGYVGALKSLRLDIKLLEAVAMEKKEWEFVFVGPEDKEFAESRLHSFPNVHFTGAKSPASLYNYIAAFDVCLNPQLLNEVTVGNYPRKIDEYLSLGKPVVATRTPAMEMFREHVFLASGKDEYIKMIAMALLNRDFGKEKRRAFAKQHTWQNTVRTMYNQIDKMFKGGYAAN